MSARRAVGAGVCVEWSDVAWVRAAIAGRWLGERGGAAHGSTAGIAGESGEDVERLGSVTLAAHQVEAVGRLRRVIEERGGALLADEVGLGKTYVAIAVAARAARVCVVGPAVLRSMWREALGRAGVVARWVSFEALSRGEVPASATEGSEAPDFVIVDEAHHVRTPGARRYGALAALCARARVLLLSATPVHNGAWDLRALLALWLGSAAAGLSEAEVAELVVRRGAGAVMGGGGAGRGVAMRVPSVGAAEWLPVVDDERVLDALLAVPPPLPPSGGVGAEVLVTMGLVRQWASSEWALRGSLVRRLGRCVALEAALEGGRYPDRRELRGWACEDGSVQLAFPELMASRSVGGSDGVAELLAAVRAHAAGLRRVCAELDRRPSVDRERVERLVQVARRHPGERIVAFSAYAATVDVVFRGVCGRVRAAAVDASGGRVAGGRLTRAEVLARFAADGGPVVEAERIEVLVATDLLGEGVNLQGASVVVHLDLPWTPVRMAQRVGRAARIGNVRGRVAVYALAPPASAARWVEVERRLREKAESAARAVGAVGAILPGLVAEGARSGAECGEEVWRIVRGWARAEWVEGDRDAVAVVTGCGRGGFLALVERGGRCELVAADSAGRVSVAPAAVLEAVRAVAGVPSGVGVGAGEVDGPASGIGSADEAWAAVERAVERWGATERVAIDVGWRGAVAAEARRRVLERVAGAIRRAPRHARGEVLALAAGARAAAVAPYGAGAERVLATLAGASLGDEAWLRAVGAFGELHARPADRPAGGAVGAADGRAERAGGGVRLLAAIVHRA